MKKYALVLLFVFLAGCNRPKIEEAPIATALVDGFEVVCLSGFDAYVTLELNEVKSAGCKSYFIKSEEVGKIESALTKVASSDGRNPFVKLELSTTSSNKQVIHLSFHYSKDTFFYEYIVDGNELTPVSSGYRDLFSNRKVLYK